MIYRDPFEWTVAPGGVTYCKEKCSVEINGPKMTIHFNSIDGLVEWTKKAVAQQEEKKVTAWESQSKEELLSELKILRTRVASQRQEIARLSKKIESAKQAL